MMQIRADPAAHYGYYQYLSKKTYRLIADGIGYRPELSIGSTEAGERARYDHRNLTCVLVTFGRQTAVSWAQLFSTAGPTMTEPASPQSLASGSLTSTDSMIGRSRFCVETSLDPGRGGSRLQPARFTMFAGIIRRSIVIVTGYEQIATETGHRFEGSVNPVGWMRTRVRELIANSNTIAIASALPSDRASFDHFSQPGYHPIASGKGSHWFRKVA